MSPEERKTAERLAELINQVRKLSQRVDELTKKKEAQKNEAEK